jgi:hypothetical protein
MEKLLMKRLLVLLAAAMVVSACGAVDGLVDQSVFSMEPGLCWDDEGEADEISTVADIDCAEPHDNEVFALLELEDGEFPGQEEIYDQAFDLCSGSAFQDYVGIDYLDSSLEVFPLTPTASGWADGDNEVVCNLYALDESKLEGSMKDAQR